jgi:hypothetical protein
MTRLRGSWTVMGKKGRPSAIAGDTVSSVAGGLRMPLHPGGMIEPERALSVDRQHRHQKGP